MSDGARQELRRVAETVLARAPRADALALDLAELEREVREFIFHWTEVIALSNEELAARFIANAPQAFRRLDERAVEDWIIEAMDAFDQRGLGAGLEVFDTLAAYVERRAGAQTSCALASVTGFLRYFVRGLGGRALSIASDPTAYTDSARIFLPPTLAVAAAREDNARLYKATAVYLWAQNRYGTWQQRALEEALRTLDLDTTWPVYRKLEAVRLSACLARDLPGLARDMARVAFADPDAGAAWARFGSDAAALAAPGTTARDSLALVAAFATRELPAAPRYVGEMLPLKVREVLSERMPREKAQLQKALSALERDLARQDEDGEAEASVAAEPANRFTVRQSDDGAYRELALRYDGEQVPLDAELQALLASIVQDVGDLGDDYLDPAAGSAPYPGDAEGAGTPGAELDAMPAERCHVYPEWDYTRERFREAFCALTEQTVPDGSDAFVVETELKYRGLAKSIRRVFEAILSEAQRQRRQPHGDELDLDALVDAHVDFVQGHEMSDRLYTHFRKSGRNVAVMFMVDMSGSTKGWVNDAEREAMLLLSEAIDTLGDAFAIYGFSGRTNKRCEVYRVKTFDEPYSPAVRRRIAGMAPKAYTRMGVAIRHLSGLLAAVPARTKLLVTLSDGKPEDYGSYRGRYGIEDTRHALLEVKRAGIHPFCITIDREAQSYLPHMYGPTNYTVVDEVPKLPYKVADIYRRLTT